MSMLGKLNKDINEQLDKKAEPHKIHWWHILFLLLLIAGTVYVVIGNKNGQTELSNSEYKKCEGNVFGTIYHITYNYNSDLQDSIETVLQEVDNSLSPFNPKSVITAINNNSCTDTNEQFREVFNLAKHVSKETDGAFDITVAPLVNAWGFGFKNKEKVTKELVANLLTHVGIDKVRLDNNRIVKTDTATMLDCSAIAKGYGVDAVGKYFESKGINNYMVEIGGEVRLRGINSKGNNWNIGIVKPDPDPLGEQQEIEQILSLTDISMATSGNYRNFYVEGNKRYAHTIDPRTGYPVQHNILSSTVIAKNCATADAYATAFMVLGLSKAQKVLKHHPELKAYFIYSDKKGNNATWHTANLEIQD